MGKAPGKGKKPGKKKAAKTTVKRPEKPAKKKAKPAPKIGLGVSRSVLIVSAIVAATFFLRGDHFVAPKRLKTDKAVPVKLVEHPSRRLTLKSRLGERRIVRGLSQKEGERMLMDLVQRAEREKAWLFDTASKTWIEVGEAAERPDRLTVYPGELGKAMAQTSGRTRNLVLYHIQPFLEELLAKQMDEHLVKVRARKLTARQKAMVDFLSKNKKEVTRICSRVFTAIPSFADVKGALKMQKETGIRKFSVACPHGITDFVVFPMTERLLKRLERDYDGLLLLKTFGNIRDKKHIDEIEEIMELASLINSHWSPAVLVHFHPK